MAAPLGQSIRPTDGLTARLLGRARGGGLGRLGAIPAVSDPLAALSDTFAGSLLGSQWTIFKPTALATSQVASGRYRHTATNGATGANQSFWFDTSTGYLVYVEIDGDGEMRIRQTVWNSTFDGLPPASQFRLVGLAVHDPDRSSVLNYVHMAAGYANGNYGVETKDTVDSDSTFPTVTLSTASPWVIDLMIRRVGSTVTTHYRNAPAVELASDVGWTQHQSIDRSDLPSTCHWGLMGYSNAFAHDIGADVDEVQFATPEAA